MATALFPLQREMILSYQNRLNQYDLQSSRLMREASLLDSVEGKPMVPVLTEITPKYLKKLNDAYYILDTISVDTVQLTNFFNSVKNGSLTNFHESIPLKDVNGIGRLKPEYLTQAIQDMGKTIDDIMNKRKAMRDLMDYVKSNPSLKIKRQIATVPNPITSIMDYLKQQERVLLTEVNQNSLSKDIIPFLKSFDARKADIANEMESVKSAVVNAATMLHKYAEAAGSIKANGYLDAPTVDCLNYYLYNQYRTMEDLISYMTFNMVVKIDNYVFNVNSLNDLYQRYVTITGENSPIKESAYEYSMAGIDLNNLCKRASDGDMSGVVDWTIRAYDAVLSAYNSANATHTTIQFILDRFTNPNFVFDNISHYLDQIVGSIDNIKPALRSTYVNPSSLLSDAGLLSIEGQTEEAKRISNTSFYDERLNNGNHSYSDILFSIMAEMRQSPDQCEKLGEKIKSVYDKFEDFYKHLEESSEIPNETARNEMKNLFNNVMNEFDMFVKELVENIITRYQNLEKICYKIMGMKGEVVECSSGIENSMDYNILAFESCINLDKELTLLMIESEMQLFKELKLSKEYGLYSEAGENNPTSGQTGAQPSDDKSGDKVGVETNTNQQTDTAKKENQDAANKTNDNNNNTENNDKKKEDDKGFFKKLIENINNFFSNVFGSFTKAINARFMKDKDFIEKFKDELLTRNYTGVQINMYNYDFNMSGQDILNDITKVNGLLSGINESNAAEYKDFNVAMDKLLEGIPLNSQIQNKTTAVQVYYKAGSKATEITKTKYTSATTIQKLVGQMVEFCEKFITNEEYKTMQSDLEKLRKSAENKVKSFDGKDLSNVNDKQALKDGITNVSKIIQIFASAALTGYKNRFQHYMYILRRCVVKKEETTEGNTNNEETNNEGQQNQNNEEQSGSEGSSQ